MIKRFPYFIFGVLFTFIACLGTFGLLGERGEGSQLFIFISLFIVGLGFLLWGIRPRTEKKTEFEACIINLNGSRKLHEPDY